MTRLTARAFDPFDRAFLSEPHGVLADFRDEQPVFFHDELGMWLISRHEDIRAVLLDHSTFRPDNALDAFTSPSFPALKTLARAGFRLPPTLANNGGTNHSELRRVAIGFIGPSQLKRARPLITDAANAAIDDMLVRLADGVALDFVETVARQIPARVILSLLGFAGLEIDRFVRWSNAALELFWGRPSEPRQQFLALEMAEFHQWLGDQLDSISGDEAGMISALLRVRTDDGQALSRQDVIGACFFTLIAGQETTMQLLASSFHHLLLEPSRWSSLQNDPTTAAGWVEEILRREPPISTWRRVTSEATRVGDVDIPKGAQVLLLMISAGSDSEIFSDAEELCPHRTNQREHLAFGLGRHRCPGAELARAEAELTLRVAAERLPPMRLLEVRPPMLELLSFRSPARVLVERA